MAWQDRPYSGDQDSSPGSSVRRFAMSSLPLFTAFGIRVRVSTMLLLLMALILVFGFGPKYATQDRVVGMAMLFVIVLLHEFGHCFAARWVGGSADEIIMNPLGGLALAKPPRRPLPTFITVAAGPFVNLLICAICVLILRLMIGHMISFKPTWQPDWPFRWNDASRYVFWLYKVSYILLLLNLLPIYPLDGGQMTQAILWPKFGYYQSMMITYIVGMVAAVPTAIVGLRLGEFALVFLAAIGFAACFQMRRILQAEGPYGFSEEPDYSASLAEPRRKRRRRSRRAIRRAKKLALADQTEQARIDQILAKVSAQGMQSLTWLERRTLRKATEHQRERDLEILPDRRDA